MLREIISIDEDTCNGCGDCIPGCPEGAIQVIDGKARLISDLMCDGLGACLGFCPEGAIAIQKREAEPYDERKVMAVIAAQGVNTIRAHLAHLKQHNQLEYHREALAYLMERDIAIDVEPAISTAAQHAGCPGSKSLSLEPAAKPAAETSSGSRPSRLTHWPIQLHLLSPFAPHYFGSDLLLAADCVPFALGDFHKDHLDGKTLAIACPKLDHGQEIYFDKLKTLIKQARIKSVTVMIMQVPCCRGLLQLALEAVRESDREVPVRCVVVGLNGEILRDERGDS